MYPGTRKASALLNTPLNLWQQVEMFKPPVIFTTFCGKGASNAYVAVADTAKLKSVLDAKLQEFNESNAMMDLVLFDQAMVRYLRRVKYAGVRVYTV